MENFRQSSISEAARNTIATLLPFISQALVFYRKMNIPYENQIETTHLISTRLKIRIISLSLSSIISGICLGCIVLALLDKLAISPLFFLAMLCSFLGVSVSCIIALLEERRYD